MKWTFNSKGSTYTDRPDHCQPHKPCSASSSSLIKPRRSKFPGSSVVRTPHSHCQGPGLNPWSGNQDPTGQSNTKRTKAQPEVSERGNSGNSARLYFLGLQNCLDGDCNHEMKRRLLFGRKTMTNLDSVLKSRDIILPTKSAQSELCFFQSSCMDVRDRQ